MLLRNVALIALAMLCVSAERAPALQGGSAAPLCRDNRLEGTGLVVGLKGSGDDLQSAHRTAELLKITLARTGAQDFGVSSFDRNAALVMIIGHIHTCVSPTGEITNSLNGPVDLELLPSEHAKSLDGGYLLPTLLYGLDGKHYAVGQGSVRSCALSGVSLAGCVADGEARDD